MIQTGKGLKKKRAEFLYSLLVDAYGFDYDIIIDKIQGNGRVSIYNRQMSECDGREGNAKKQIGKSKGFIKPREE